MCMLRYISIVCHSWHLEPCGTFGATLNACQLLASFTGRILYWSPGAKLLPCFYFGSISVGIFLVKVYVNRRCCMCSPSWGLVLSTSEPLIFQLFIWKSQLARSVDPESQTIGRLLHNVASNMSLLPKSGYGWTDALIVQASIKSTSTYILQELVHSITV